MIKRALELYRSLSSRHSVNSWKDVFASKNISFDFFFNTPPSIPSLEDQDRIARKKMVEQRRRYFQRGPGQGNYNNKRRKNATENEGEEGNNNPVPAPSNEKELTPQSGLDAVNPYWRLPYLKQLKKKRSDVVKALRRALRETQATFAKHNKEANKLAEDRNEPAPAKQLWEDSLLYAKTAGRGLLCPLSQVFESPDLDGYRNKNEFSLGIDMNGEKSAGFQVGRYAAGESRIGGFAGCRTAPPVALGIAELTSKFIRQSPYGVWDKATHTGFFRLVIVRNSTSLGQLMVVLQVNPKAIEGGVEGDEFKKFIAEFRQFFVSECFGGELSQKKAAEGGFPLPPSDAPGNDELQNTVPTAEGLAFSEKYGHSLTCLGIQLHDGISNAASDNCEVVQVFGPKSIYDVIDGLTFRVDLNSFFQVNNRGAEMLYKKAAQWALAPPHDFAMPPEAVLECYGAYPEGAKEKWIARHTLDFQMLAASGNVEDVEKSESENDKEDTETKEQKDIDDPQSPGFIPPSARYVVSHDYPVVPLPETPDASHASRTLLLDICCGTGTIGLIMSKTVREVVGLELVPAAIEDAKFNAGLNQITNAYFVCGKAEDTIKKVLKDNESALDMAVGIVDPPRAGLHNDVVRALRASKLNRIVYVSCNAATLADNVSRLCGPTTKKYINEPFVPIASICVDMFPHTPHCEVVMLLERRPKSFVKTEAVEKQDQDTTTVTPTA